MKYYNRPKAAKDWTSIKALLLQGANINAKILNRMSTTSKRIRKKETFLHLDIVF